MKHQPPRVTSHQMQQPPQIFDPATVAYRHKRATEDGLFLQRHAKEQLLSRLQDVNRPFTKLAIVTPYPEIWSGLDADIIGPTDTLDFPHSDYDAILHALCLHQMNDPLGQIIQCQRALKPDGLFLGSMFGGESLSLLRDVLTRTELQISGGAAARVHPMIEIRDAGALLQRAGLTLPVADLDPIDISFKSFFHMLHDLRHMGEANALAKRLKRPTARNLFLTAAAEYPTTDGTRVNAIFDTIYLSGWCPHESQQKPLRPGSAKISLADFLGDNKSAADD